MILRVITLFLFIFPIITCADSWEDYDLSAKVMDRLDDSLKQRIENFNYGVKEWDLLNIIINGILDDINKEEETLDYKDRLSYMTTMYFRNNELKEYLEKNGNQYPLRIQEQLSITRNNIDSLNEMYLDMITSDLELAELNFNPVGSVYSGPRPDHMPTIRLIDKREIVVREPRSVNIRSILEDIINIYALSYYFKLHDQKKYDMGIRIKDNYVIGYGITSPLGIEETYNRGPKSLFMEEERIPLMGLFSSNRNLVDFFRGQSEEAGNSDLSRRDIMSIVLNLRNETNKQIGSFIVLENIKKVDNKSLIPFNARLSNYNNIKALMGIHGELDLDPFFILTTYLNDDVNNKNAYQRLSELDRNNIRQYVGLNNIFVNEINQHNIIEAIDNPYKFINKELTDVIINTEVMKNAKTGGTRWELEFSLYIYY